LNSSQNKQITEPKKSTIYDYDDRIKRTWNLIRKELSKENQELIERYDNEMIALAKAKATRHKHLQTILNLCRYVGKNWDQVIKNDVSNLVIIIMKEYSDENGQETYTSYDHKKILKIFYRWYKLGSRDQRDVGDPPETKSVKLITPKDKLVREDLLTDEELLKNQHVIQLVESWA
jgi:hypothetical protein